MTTDIQELFNRDPLSLTSEDIDEIIRTLREKRAQYASTPSKSPKKEKVEAEKIDLASLGLE